MNPTMAHTSLNDDKFQMQIDQDRENEDQDQLIKSGRLRERRQQIPFRWTSLVLPSLLGLLLLIGTILLILTITRRNTCLRQQVEQTEAILGYIPDADVNLFLVASFFFFVRRLNLLLDKNLVTMCENQSWCMCLSCNIYSFQSQS